MQQIERYTSSARWFHWVHVVAFLWLALSGLLLFGSWFGFTPVGIWIRIIHRVGAVLLLGAPLLYAILHIRKSWSFIKEAFTWGKVDLEWVKAAPGYYFGNDKTKMPPQGYINTGMKLFRLCILLGMAIFIITGLILWFFKGTVPPEVIQYSLLLHDIAFILSICFLFIHIQLAVLHPKMDEGLLSIVDGKVSAEYAKSHHGLWYDETVKNGK
ncbi:MAG: cytochrome b/b6 domain-containing protein [Dehalococcoidales bacterium]|nr:cytochrome b/b6 domain-containing protein [Dehalococcoidales bacterium]